jgi:hypothetical protein
MHTVISAFEDRAAAERAVDRLAEAGFSRGNIHLHEDRAGDKGDFEEGRHRGVLSSIGHFFVSIFGRDTPDRDANYFSEAARRGHAVVTADIETEQDVDRAAAILDELGAIDIEERAEQWRSSGWTEPTDSPTPPTGVQMMVGPSKRRSVRVLKRAGEPHA